MGNDAKTEVDRYLRIGKSPLISVVSSVNNRWRIHTAIQSCLHYRVKSEC